MANLKPYLYCQESNPIYFCITNRSIKLSLFVKLKHKNDEQKHIILAILFAINLCSWKAIGANLDSFPIVLINKEYTVPTGYDEIRLHGNEHLRAAGGHHPLHLSRQRHLRRKGSIKRNKLLYLPIKNNLIQQIKT